MPTATLSSKGQLTMPAEVRADLRLETGDRVAFERVGDGSYRIRALKGDVRALRGILRSAGPPLSIEDMNKAVMDAAAEKFERSNS